MIDLIPPSIILPLILLIPLISAINIFTSKSPNIVNKITLISFATLLLISEIILLILHFSLPEHLSFVFVELLPSAQIFLAPDTISVIFSLGLSILWFITSIYSVGYVNIHKLHNQRRFFGWLNISVLAAHGIALSGNLLTMFIFYELLTISTYPLVIHKQTEIALNAGRKYLLLLIAPSIACFLPAIIIFYIINGTTDFIIPTPQNTLDILLISVLLLLFIIGIAKTAIIPMHKWLIYAMVAPIPISAFLHAVAVVNSGLFVLFKVFLYIIPIHYIHSEIDTSLFSGKWLLYLASFSILWSAMQALRQDNIKLMLAYSTINQLSYVILILSFFSDSSIIFGLFYMFAHSIAKITLFFCAGNFILAAPSFSMSEMKGISKIMPFTTLCFTLAAISIIGLPPSIGFFAKYLTFSVALQEAQYFAIIVIIISTIITSIYYIKFIYNAYYGTNNLQYTGNPEASYSIKISLSICILLVYAGFYISTLLF